MRAGLASLKLADSVVVVEKRRSSRPAGPGRVPTPRRDERRRQHIKSSPLERTEMDFDLLAEA